MNEYSPRIRRMSMHDFEFSKKIEDIFCRIASLDKTTRQKKRIPLKNCQKDWNISFFPVLTFVKTPVPVRNRDSPQKSPKHLSYEQKQRKIKHVSNVSFDLDKEGFDSKRKDERNNERFKRIMNLTQNMISKDNLRGWSRN
jgi:hypothetical protein